MTELALKQVAITVSVSVIIPLNIDAKEVTGRLRQEITDTTTRFIAGQRNLILVSNETNLAEKTGTLNGLS